MNVASIPGWSSRDGDEIICIAELKLGLIGMSCVVPGFSTMVKPLEGHHKIRKHVRVL